MWQAGIQEFRAIRIKTEVKEDASLAYAEITFQFDIVFFAGTGDFAWPVMFEIAEFNAYADLINIFDPTGTYTPPRL